MGDPTMLFFFSAMILVMYFFFLRPSMKQQKELKEFRNNLKKGQLVVTTGGIHGKIVQVDDNQSYLTIDVGNTKIKVEKAHITQLPAVEADKK